MNVNHDDFFSRNKNNVSRFQFEAISLFDRVFVTRRVNIMEIFPFNPNVEFFPFSYDPEIHKRYELTDDDISKYECDVLFIGTYESSRARLLNELVSKNRNVNVIIYGEGWERLDASSKLRSSVRGKKGLWMEEMGKAIQCARITVGFLRKENRDEYTQRSFEVPACFGFLLAENSDFHKELFVENLEAVFFDPFDYKSFEEKIHKYLSDETLRMNIRKSGYEKIRDLKFTYIDRINQILESYENHLLKNVNSAVCKTHYESNEQSRR